MSSPPTVAVIGGGPAGLMAAEVLSAGGARVTVYERMPSVARKLLIAGRGGLNLTHSEGFEDFVRRYGVAAEWVRPMLEAFGQTALRAWTDGLGQSTFIGTSRRVFPKAMKASPLLRAWLARLAQRGVVIRTRSEWLGWDGDALRFAGAGVEERVKPDVTILALGGASWPRLGSTGSWQAILDARGIEVTSLTPANAGVTIAWSSGFAERFAGEPLKGIGLSAPGRSVRGEAVVSSYGLEGGAVYALGGLTSGETIVVDLRPEQLAEDLTARLERSRLEETLSNRLRKAVKLSPVAIGLMREGHGKDLPREPAALGAAIKAVPLKVTGVQGLERAISSTGGVRLDQVNEHLMLKAMPGVFVAGEMLDWSAPTGGYLLQACFATGVAAGKGALAWLGL